MRLLIKNGYILSLDPQDRVFEHGNILIDGTTIIALGTELDTGELHLDQIIDASDKLVVPGLVNADMHAIEFLSKGLFENQPLDLRPIISDKNGDFGPDPARMVYITALLAGIQALKSGVTTIKDHWRFSAAFAGEGVAAVLGAYKQAGLRASLALEIDADSDSVEQIINAYEETLNNSQKTDREHLDIVISPPQELLANALFVNWLKNVFKRKNTAIHFHFNQTKCQVISAQELFQGKTAIEKAGELGLLDYRTSISHAVWVTPVEIKLLASSEVTVIHTPLSDLYTGSGVVPLHLLQEAGVHIGLGSGEGCGGNLTLFDTLKMTAEIHRIVQPDYKRWVSVEQALAMATHGGARACQMDGQIGQIAAGCKADLVLYDLKSFAFSPLNNPKDQLVCLEDGSSVDTVLVNGSIVVENGKVTAVDETDILKQFRKQFEQQNKILQNSASQALQLERPRTQRREIEPQLDDTYRKCVSEPLEIRRWADNPVLDSHLKQAFVKKG